MSFMYLYGIAVQILLPIGLIAWIFLRRPGTVTDWVLPVLCALSVVGYGGIAGLWLMPPIVTPLIFFVLTLLAGYRSWRRIPESDSQGHHRSRRFLLGFWAVLTLSFLVLSTYAVSGWVPPESPDSDPAKLSFPLKNGLYYVANGGGRELINPHMKTLRPEKRRYRGQSYAVDLIRLNAFGLYASGFFPSDPSKYPTYGDGVYAPCRGSVLHTRDGMPDGPLPRTNTERREGNYVFLRCGEYDVLLAHLKQGSIRVKKRDTLNRGDQIGLVGSSGFSTLPHLHIHAQRPAEDAGILSGEPVPMLLDGDYLVRNELVYSVR